MLSLRVRMLVIAVFALTVTFVGCSTPLDRAPSILKERFILIHEDGYALGGRGGVANLRQRDGDFASRVQEIVKAIDTRAQAVRTTGVPCRAPAPAEGPGEQHAVKQDGEPCLRLLLFVHGGMNSYAADYERMVKLLGDEGGGAASGSRTSQPPLLSGERTLYHPIFINWNSNLADSIVDDVMFIRFGQRHRTGFLTAPLVLLSRAGSAVFGAPLAWSHMVENMRESWRGGGKWSREDSLELADQIVWFVPRLVTTPLVEAFGTPAWNIMKRRAQLTVASRIATARQESEMSRNGEEVPAAEEGAGRTLIRALSKRMVVIRVPPTHEETGYFRAGSEATLSIPYWNIEGSDSRYVRVEITLVGHSMGAIVLNRILAAFSERFPVKEIVYLAPAAGIDEMDGFVRPYLARNEDARFWVFTLSRKDEARESLALAPKGTLLTYIDTHLEIGYTQGQATQGRLVNVLSYYQSDIEKQKQCEEGVKEWADPVGFRKETAAAAYVSPFNTKQVHVYVTCRKGNEGPRKHGDFDEPRYLGQALCTVDRDAFRRLRERGETKEFCSSEGALHDLPPSRNEGRLVVE